MNMPVEGTVMLMRRSVEHQVEGNVGEEGIEMLQRIAYRTSDAGQWFITRVR